MKSSRKLSGMMEKACADQIKRFMYKTGGIFHRGKRCIVDHQGTGGSSSDFARCTNTAH
ncbi:MAG: hypothetical protein JW795_15295 [Chitinivibrionales bacterium]|nr:hypothetical protein [Chitinivibrionales bacterium]